MKVRTFLKNFFLVLWGAPLAAPPPHAQIPAYGGEFGPTWILGTMDSLRTL